MTITTTTDKRVCAECRTSGEQVVLFDIILPPLIRRKTPVCRPCLDTIMDRERRRKENVTS